MRPLRRYAVVLLVCLPVIWPLDSAWACFCTPPRIPDAIASADAIFTGIVVDSREVPVSESENGEEFVYRIDVTRAWKGSVRGRIEVRTAQPCAETFTPGDHYLVYAARRSGQLWTDMCTRNARLEDARGDFAHLGQPGYGDSEHVVPQPTIDEYVGELIAAVNAREGARLFNQLIYLEEGLDRVVPALVDLLETGPKRDQEFAVRILGAYGYEARSAIPQIIEFLCADGYMPTFVWYTLRNICPECQPYLVSDVSGETAPDCAARQDSLRAMDFAPLPPDSLMELGDWRGPMYILQPWR